MNSRVLFHDTRLQGTVSNFDAWRTCKLDRDTSLASAFAFLESMYQVHREKISELCILCHGIGSYDLKRNEVLHYREFVGGRGLALGREGLVMSNVHDWSRIRNLAENIIVYSCSVAETHDGAEFTDEDGDWLMRQLAEVTNANVYASDAVQRYFEEGMDFGYWEGNLFKYTPAGQVQAVNQFLFN